MKTLTLVLSIIFIVLTFAGAGYVLLNEGKVNAGHAVVPMVFALASVWLYRQKVIIGAEVKRAEQIATSGNSVLSVS